MRVYAHNYKDVNGVEYRWRTLLQFGSSWEVIGSVVMKNPGSSSPTPDDINEEDLQQLRKFDDKERWWPFSVDNTMINIERLFKTYYQNNKGDCKLNGVIQVFNLFNVKDANIKTACEKIENKDSLLPIYNTVDEDLYLLKAPIYLGWGALGYDAFFRPYAEKIFNKTIKKGENVGNYLKEKFSDNLFYHPQYLMGYGKNRNKSHELLIAFCKNTPLPNNNNIEIIDFTISKDDIFSSVYKHLDFENLIIKSVKYNPTKTVCIHINESLIMTITKQENGYIGIRHSDFNGNINYSTDYYPNKDQYRSLLKNEFNYNIAINSWLGKKLFKDYGSDNEEIVEGIKEEIRLIKVSFKSI